MCVGKRGGGGVVGGAYLKNLNEIILKCLSPYAMEVAKTQGQSLKPN